MSQRTARRRRKQATQGDNHLAPWQRRWAKAVPVKAQGKRAGKVK